MPHEAWLHQAGYHMKSFDQQVQRNALSVGLLLRLWAHGEGRWTQFLREVGVRSVSGSGGTPVVHLIKLHRTELECCKC